MKTLIIHLQDPTTDFLSAIYLPYLEHDWTMLRTQPPPGVVCQLIAEHDRVIMLGHGSPGGLFGREWPYVIGEREAPLLRGKDNIYIWCHASDYAKEHGLTGFATGMFISEEGEARFCGVDSSEEQITVSNRAFAESVGKHVNEDYLTLFLHVTGEYGTLSSEVARYNLRRLDSFQEPVGHLLNR